MPRTQRKWWITITIHSDEHSKDTLPIRERVEKEITNKKLCDK